jgi:hypothetical protein
MNFELTKEQRMARELFESFAERIASSPLTTLP